jgi:hypothetical protein
MAIIEAFSLITGLKPCLCRQAVTVQKMGFGLIHEIHFPDSAAFPAELAVLNYS